MRDTSPDYIRALMRKDAMTIPANGEIRPARTGPVFSVLPDGSLHMRYTARTHSIEWSPDPLVNEAREALAAFLESESPFIFRATLQPGQGLICNNVLHTRSGFSDSDQHTRKLYRLRYYQRISGT
jgi:alpha-ketoglutarate-dependent taurine dioxygenase